MIIVTPWFWKRSILQMSLGIFAWRKAAKLLIIMSGHLGLWTGESLMNHVYGYMINV